MASREDEMEQNDSVSQEVEDVSEQEVEDVNEQENESHDQEENEDDEEPVENEVSKVESEAENDSDEEFAGFDEEEITKKAETESDDGQNEVDDDEEETIQTRRVKNTLDSDEEEVGQVEGEENAEGGSEEVEGEEPQNVEGEEVAQEQESDEEEFARPMKKSRGDKPSDLEMMLQKNKEQKAKNRRKKGGDSEEINDWDNKISMIISEMKNVAAEDRAANEKQIMSLQKHKMLPDVQNMLMKTDFHATMIELGVLGAIAEWLAPLPDRSLPNVLIREFMIDTLRDFGEINGDYLKSSGIGKAVMFLYKHSKETKSNKKKLERLINDWSRPIFNLDGNFKQLSKEERLERDLEHVKMMNKREKSSSGRTMDDLLDATETRKSKKPKKSSSDSKEASDEPKKFLRPGEVGFCPRARVPIPSSKDYVIRPKSNVEAQEMEAAQSSRKGKKSESRLDKHKKRFEELKKQQKSSRAVTMVAAGGK